MDKSWMQKCRVSVEYIKGCKDFLEFAWKSRPPGSTDRIYCPCIRCLNAFIRPIDEVKDHILNRGILRTYIRWTKHGEDEETTTHHTTPVSNVGDDMHTMLHDAFGIPNEIGGDGFRSHEPSLDESAPNEHTPEEPNKEAKKFFKLLKEAETPLYPGCNRSSKLSFIVRLLHVKCTNGWSNKSFDMLLQVLVDSLPDEINFPKNHYEAKRQLRDLGLDCIKIDACPNDCMLYWKGVDKYLDQCDICGESRWISSTPENIGKNSEEDSTSSSKTKKKAAKILRYFPLTTRLQRLFMCSKTAEDMIWHDKGRTKDGVLRHPADAAAWKALDTIYPSFGSEPRNVRLGLASDGFNPFGTMSTSHSTWPIVVIPYNLPPWMCMKQSNIIMSLLIPGPSGPGNNIDVYLRPLVDELKELWSNGAETYDAYSKQNFQMRVAMLWTINDFPAYANLSGWSTKGFLACPCCHEHTYSERLVHGNKCCYMGHRRFLPKNHRFRKNKSSFNGCIEMGNAPKPLSGNDILEQLNGYDQITFGKAEHDKAGQKRKRDDNSLPHNWKKISIFLELEYYKDLLLRNNLDVMHIEKNNGESLVGTLLNMEGKTKDTLKARLDMQLMGIRETLHPKLQGDDKYFLPPASYNMATKEKKELCYWYKDVKLPDSYSSNISRRVQVNGCKISGLKSHDWHVLMQQLLPVATRGIVSKEVTTILVELSTFYRKLCSKVLTVNELNNLEEYVTSTLCKMEMLLPPAFFDVMVHLQIHLASEALIGGPVNYRWMYPIERYLYTLKRYVRNKSRPEGSIAEGYLADECLTFCSRYLDDEIETKFNRVGRNSDDCAAESPETLSIFVETGRVLGKTTFRNLTNEEWEQARLYVLNNCDEVRPFVEKHKQIIRDSANEEMTVRDVDLAHNEKFGWWFERHIHKLKEDGETVDKHLDILSFGPSRSVACSKGYIVNGFRFHTKDRERNRKSQNSGVFVNAEISTFAHPRDTNPITDNVGYYGVLNDVVELHYPDEKRITVFKCRWFDVLKKEGVKRDEYGYTSLNLDRTCAENEPFIFASQAQQSFYVKDNLNKGWCVALRTQPRDFYDMGSQVEAIQEISSSLTENELNAMADTTQPINNWNRSGVEGVEVVVNADERDQESIDNDCNEDFINDSDCDQESISDHDEDYNV